MYFWMKYFEIADSVVNSGASANKSPAPQESSAGVNSTNILCELCGFKPQSRCKYEMQEHLIVQHFSAEIDNLIPKSEPSVIIALINIQRKTEPPKIATIRD